MSVYSPDALRLRPPPTLAVLAIALGTACGGGASYTGETYRDAEATYRIGGPGSGWTSLDVEGQNDLAWSHSDLAAVIQVNASCSPELDVRLDVLTNHLLIGFTDRDIRSQETVPLDAREALRTHVVAKLDGVPREMLLVILKKDGCIYDFALIAPPGPRFERARTAYDALLGGFHAGGDQ